MIVTREYINRIFGDFWSAVWQEPSLLETMTAAYQEVFTQLECSREELEEYMAREQLPLSFFRHFRLLSVSESDLLPEYRTLGSFNLDDGVTLDSLKTAPMVYRTSLPVDDISVIMDSPVNPTVVWQKGQEFEIIDGRNIRFFRDPVRAGFLDGAVSEGGAVVPRCRFWLCSTMADINALRDFYGVYFKLRTPSTVYYKRVVNAVWDLAVQGATLMNINRFFCAVADTDVPQLNGTVDRIWTENGRTWISTGSELCSAPSPGTATVAVGDTVTAGQNLFDTALVYKGTSEISVSDMPLIHLGSGFLSSSYTGGLVFENIEYTVTSHRFPVGGDVAVVEQFWADVETAAAADGIDLWALIKADQKYPYTVNPFDFLRRNLLKNNMFFVKFRPAAIPDPDTNLSLLGYLLDRMPTGTTFIAYADGDAGPETVDASIASDRPAEAFHVGVASELEKPGATEYIRGNLKLY